MTVPTVSTVPTVPTRDRCSLASLERDESLTGTATHVRPFLLVESAGPWGVEALRDARLPPDVLDRLRDASAGAKVLLIRRHGRADDDDGRTRVVVAYADPRTPWAEAGELDSPAQLGGLDLAAWGRGERVGLPPVTEPVLAVCTHGRHDVCCAEQGRPVARALAERWPTRTWECSHLGGDRYAGNLLVLPYGLYYGRLDPDTAVHVVAELDQGRIELDHLRGRSGYPMPVQAAEVAIRRELGETGLTAVRLVGRATDRVDGALRTRARWSVGGRTYDVVVHTVQGPPARLTCRAIRESPTPRHEVLSID